MSSTAHLGHPYRRQSNRHHLVARPLPLLRLPAMEPLETQAPNLKTSYLVSDDEDGRGSHRSQGHVGLMGYEGVQPHATRRLIDFTLLF